MDTTTAEALTTTTTSTEETTTTNEETGLALDDNYYYYLGDYDYDLETTTVSQRISRSKEAEKSGVGFNNSQNIVIMSFLCLSHLRRG